MSNRATPALSYKAMHCKTQPSTNEPSTSHACPALPRHAQPSRAVPCHAEPRPAPPCRATPALPCRAEPRQALPALQYRDMP